MTWHVHTRANGFKRWVAVQRKETKAAALAAVEECRRYDDPMWATAEYLVCETLHPLATQEANA